MTTEMRIAIETLMTETCGCNWIDADWTEAMCEAVCERCPYAAQCEHICFGCPCWEEAMGEDL